MDDRRHPHIPFDPALLGPFLRGRRIAAAELLTAGKCNTNYKVTLADGDMYVLRLRSRGDADREAYVMGLARGLVPTPEEVARGPAWSLYTFLPGVPLADAPEHCGAAAEALARIASVRFASSGWIQADGFVNPFSFATGGDGDETGDFIAAMLARADVREWIGPEAARAIPAIMRREAGRTEEAFADVRLVHGDFNPTNILIHRGTVSGVLDWEFAHAGTPYMDIGNLLRHAGPAYAPRIRAGLEAGGLRLRDDWQDLAALIDVGSQLEFLTSARSDDFKRQCVARIHAFVARFGG